MGGLEKAKEQCVSKYKRRWCGSCVSSFLCTHLVPFNQLVDSDEAKQFDESEETEKLKEFEQLRRILLIFYVTPVLLEGALEPLLRDSYRQVHWQQTEKIHKHPRPAVVHRDHLRLCDDLPVVVRVLVAREKIQHETNHEVQL